jgi:N-acetylmuramoyl-L-alanine amidase
MAFTAYASSYTVRPGDSLYAVGKLFNTNSWSIISTNKLSSSVIYPGQILYVPASTYVVKSGDSLYLTAKKFSLALIDLKNANNLSSNYIYPGEKLVIPGGTSITPASTSSSTVVNGVISYTASDVDLLARLITAEADGEPYSAKVAVGAVIVNRVQDPRFPKTISSVIYQIDNGYYQFTPVENGLINKSASLDSINAAKAALRGEDPTNGAIYYFDDSTTNAWIWSKPIALRIDKMVYTY